MFSLTCRSFLFLNFPVSTPAVQSGLSLLSNPEISVSGSAVQSGPPSLPDQLATPCRALHPAICTKVCVRPALIIQAEHWEARHRLIQVLESTQAQRTCKILSFRLVQPLRMLFIPAGPIIIHYSWEMYAPQFNGEMSTETFSGAAIMEA